jgi:2'-5' RNA ligase
MLQKASSEALDKLSEEIRIILCAENIQGKVEKNHHLTLAYQKNITTKEVAEVLKLLNTFRKHHENIQLIDPQKKYDHTLHQVTARESSINGKVYIVLTPHNETSIYKDFMLDKNIQPHITLTSVSCSLEFAQEYIVPKVKNLLKTHIQDKKIVPDLSEIITHTK